MIALKKINSGDVTEVCRKNTWVSGTIYDMWRNDISRDNPSQPLMRLDIYDANYYVINEDYRVYICLYNNATPENNFQGGPSLINHFSLTLNQEAGSSGDGYIWKYLFTISPSQLSSLTLQTTFLYQVTGRQVPQRCC